MYSNDGVSVLWRVYKGEKVLPEWSFLIIELLILDGKRRREISKHKDCGGTVLWDSASLIINNTDTSVSLANPTFSSRKPSGLFLFIEMIESVHTFSLYSVISVLLHLCVLLEFSFPALVMIPHFYRFFAPIGLGFLLWSTHYLLANCC